MQLFLLLDTAWLPMQKNALYDSMLRLRTGVFDQSIDKRVSPKPPEIMYLGIQE